MDQPLGSRYRIGEVLGRGGMGAVHRGMLGDGSPCAIKVLRPELAADPEVVTRFVRERAVLTGVRDEHLIAVHDLVVEGDTLAIVMDLVPGPDLRSALRAAGGVLPPAEVARIGAGVAAALGAAHARGVVHRDVKPENVLLDERTVPPAVRLADFGIARLVGDSRLSQLTGLIGTPNYFPPEVCAGEPPGPAADRYALGVLLYELSCGVPPFAGDLVAVLAGHVGLRPGRPPGIPDPLWTHIAALLEKDPAARPSDTGLLAVQLSTLSAALRAVPAAPRLTQPPAASAVGPSAHQANATQVVAPPRRSRRGASKGTVLLALLVGAAAGVAAGWSLRGGDEPAPAADCTPGVLSQGCAAATETRVLQERLVDLCWYERNDAGNVDGAYGPGTVTAVARFQAFAGLPGTGSFDEATRARLFAADAPARCPAPQPSPSASPPSSSTPSPTP